MTRLPQQASRAVARRTALRWTALVPLTIVVGGCQLAGGGPAPRRFRLTAPSEFPPDLPQVDWSLVVEEPQAPRTIDTMRIARITSGIEVQYYEGSEWVDRAPLMAHGLLLEAFRNSQRIEAVAGPRTGLRGDFVLRWSLREFQAEQTAEGPTSIYCLTTVGLVQMPRRNVVGTTDIESLVPVEDRGIEAIVAAFDRALGNVLRDIVVWTLTTGQMVALTS